jgi:hypothetical protein
MDLADRMKLYEGSGSEWLLRSVFHRSRRYHFHAEDRALSPHSEAYAWELLSPTVASALGSWDVPPVAEATPRCDM